VLKKIKKSILDTLFPVNCLGCGEENVWVCPKCLSAIKLNSVQFCPVCEKAVTVSGNLCPRCKEKGTSWLDGILATAAYEDPLLKKIIHSFKYRFVEELFKPLSKIMLRGLVNSDFFIPQLIVPVPLHRRKLRYRGFNQCLLLAKAVSINLAPGIEIEVADILERKKNNRAQMKIKNYRERIRNVEGIFRLKPECSDLLLKDKTVLLIDDIATTGATLQECAKVLRASGAKKVFASVIARQTAKN
jgi:ComF family protein